MKPQARFVFLAALSTWLLSACTTNAHIDNPTASVSISAQDQPGKAADSQPKYQEFIASGEQLPIESVEDVDGNTIDLANPEKRKLVILFATWCSDSNRALKALNQSELLNDPSIEVIAIAREENVETVKQWRDENGIKVPLAADPDRSIFKQFAAAGIPRLITVDSNNQIIKMNLAEGKDQLALIKW